MYASTSVQSTLDAGLGNYNTIINPTVSISDSHRTQQLQSKSTTNWNLLGGTANLVNLLDVRNSSAAIKAWKATINANPVPVSYRLKEVGHLISDFNFQQEVSRAIASYLTIPDEDLPNVVAVEFSFNALTNKATAQTVG